RDPQSTMRFILAVLKVGGAGLMILILFGLPPQFGPDWDESAVTLIRLGRQLALLMVVSEVSLMDLATRHRRLARDARASGGAAGHVGPEGSAFVLIRPVSTPGLAAALFRTLLKGIPVMWACTPVAIALAVALISWLAPNADPIHTAGEVVAN